MIFIAWFAWEKNRSSPTSFMHSSNLSTLTNPVTKLTHMASFYLWEPPKNNGLSNCSLLTLLSNHFVKSCSSAVLFYDADQYWSISTGKDWSQPEIIVSMSSSVVFRLSSLALMLFSLYTSKTLPNCMTWKESWIYSRNWWKNCCMFLGLAFLLTPF